jgi:phosphotransferase system enzyme I (PtsP)
MVVTVVPSDTISTGPAFESSLLLTLEEISRLVSHSHHPGETLANIVRLIQGRFHTDVCSVYVLEPEKGQLVLGATIGLKPESVGRVRMRIDEGLSGLVAEKLAPVMVEDAFEHPRFKFFPEAGEDPYHSFLGVPLIEGGVLQGVLVVQTREPRTFSLNEVRLLVTVAAQLAPLVSEALLLEQVVAATHEERRLPASPCGPISWRGIALSPGVGVGRAYVINGFDEWQRSVPPRTADLGQEQRRLADAMDAARDELQRLSQRISALVGEEHGAILQGQLMIMQDGTIEEDLKVCLSSGATAESALLETLDKYAAAFQKLTNPYFQERVYDIKDVFRRVLWHLRPRASGEEPGCERLVLVSRDVSVMDLFSVDLDRLAAVVAEQGGPQSHAAILARSLGIPMVAQVPELIREVRSGRLLRVDGGQGDVCMDPPATALACEPPTTAFASSSRLDGAGEYSPVAGLPRIEANINLISEVAHAVQHGAAGVGLYRSEFIFLARRTLATEDEQVEIYRKLLEGLDGRPATIRTYDFRPDKVNQVQTPGFSAGHRLDWRRVLDSLPLQKLFKDQVRAIMRAGVAGPARILVPLVTRSEQLDFVVDAVGRARDELRREGRHHAADVPMGVMIEVAAAIPLAESWTPNVDFFALGTNDLAASALGISRDDPVELAAGDPLHPGFLRIVSEVIDAARRAHRPVTVCGEMASDPDATIALSALGVNSLSVAVHRLAVVRHTLGGIAPHALPELAEELPHLRTAGEVRNFVQSEVIRY